MLWISSLTLSLLQLFIARQSVEQHLTRCKWYIRRSKSRRCSYGFGSTNYDGWDALKNACGPEASSFEEIFQGAENIEYVTGIPVNTTMSYVIHSRNGQVQEEVAAWSGIERGSDLFIKGWGGFDVMEACSRRVKQREIEQLTPVLNMFVLERLKEKAKTLNNCRHDGPKKELIPRLIQHPDFNGPLDIALLAQDSEPRDFHPTKGKGWRGRFTPEDVRNAVMHNTAPWLVGSPTDLTIEAYFGDVIHEKWVFSALRAILGAGRDCPMRLHLIANYHSWRQERNLNSLDEVVAATNAFLQGENPFWPDGWEYMNPQQLLSVRRKEVLAHLPLGGPQFNYFHHLDDLKDKGRMKVLRSRHEVRQIGEQMKNCAGSYVPDVANGGTLLVALMKEDKVNVPRALGMISYSTDDKRLQTTWSQIYLSCNRVASEEDKKHFYDFEPQIKAWLNATSS